MVHSKYLLIVVIVGSLFLNACHTDNGGKESMPGVNAGDTASVKTSVMINSIPFPIDLLDSLYDLKANYNGTFINPADHVSLYSESNAQAANLGVYGADLAYVISFEQFQSVGVYMKACKSLADNLGIPLAFAEQVIARCEKNQNNKDSLSAILVQSYTNIDQTLKQNERSASEVLVLTGGWLEGVYLSSQSLIAMPDGANKSKVRQVLLEQKQYCDKLIALLTQVSATSPYCFNLTTPMQQIKTAYDGITSQESLTDEKVTALADKVKALRALIIKGNS